jgi:hypothetical protein
MHVTWEPLPATERALVLLGASPGSETPVRCSDALPFTLVCHAHEQPGPRLSSQDVLERGWLPAPVTTMGPLPGRSLATAYTPLAA